MSRRGLPIARRRRDEEDIIGSVGLDRGEMEVKVLRETRFGK